MMPNKRLSSVTPLAVLDETDESGNDVKLSNLVPEFIVNAVITQFGQIQFVIKFKDTGTQLIPSKVANKMFPEVVIEFYEKHIQWNGSEENIQASKDEFIVIPSANTHRDLQVRTTTSIQSMSYMPGTYVWVRLENKLWWPGKVIDPLLMPNELLVLCMKTKRNPVAVVYFERDHSYEIVKNEKKILLYSCDNKIEILKKGYLLCENQKKNGTWLGGFHMEHFIEDVKSIERELNGDINIFDQFKPSKCTPLNIKELFMTIKERKQREKKQLLKALKAARKVPKSKHFIISNQYFLELLAELPIIQRIIDLISNAEKQSVLPLGSL